MELTAELKKEIKEKVSIPRYFDEIIIPQLEGYYSDYTVDFEAKPTAKCPLHDEDTPSFRFYSDTDSFFCFGCRAAGDVIALHQKFSLKQNGTLPYYKDAAEFLYKYFIQGQESTTVFQKPAKLMPDIELSTKHEMLAFGGMMHNIESRLMASGLEIVTKREIWRMIDTYSILVHKNLLNATEAKKEVERAYQEKISK
jgi:hypothetical protein